MFSRWRIPKIKKTQPVPEPTSGSKQNSTNDGKQNANSWVKATQHGSPNTPENLLALQRTTGNQAVNQLLQTSQTSPLQNTVPPTLSSLNYKNVPQPQNDTPPLQTNTPPLLYKNTPPQQSNTPSTAVPSRYTPQNTVPPTPSSLNYKNVPQLQNDTPPSQTNTPPLLYKNTPPQQANTPSTGAPGRYTPQNTVAPTPSSLNYKNVPQLQNDTPPQQTNTPPDSFYTDNAERGFPTNQEPPSQTGSQNAPIPMPGGKFNRAEWEKNLPNKDSQAVKLSKRGLFGKPLRPAPLKLPGKFKGEDKKFGWRAHYGAQDDEPEEEKARRAREAETDTRVTRYYSSEDRKKNTLRPNTPDRGPTEYAMNTKNRIVMNDGRNIVDRGEGKDATLHHSSLFAGGEVAHAGHIGVSGGKVNYLDDDSGHYRPTAAHTWDAYNRMKKQGLLSNKGTVSMVDKTKQKGIDSDYNTSKLNLPFSSYEQTHGNEEQARKKQAMLQELLALKK